MNCKILNYVNRKTESRERTMWKNESGEMKHALKNMKSTWKRKES